MVKCECAPPIVAAMSVWTALGGANWGCCGNKEHTSGFHLPAANLSTSDYSRRRDPAWPTNMAYATAGDFAHLGNPVLRGMHAVVLARLMRGELPMIAEFIGQPWADRPVYYWARWLGVANLKKYIGPGHDRWSHISLWRSRANEQAALWVPSGPVPASRKPGGLVVDGRLGPATIRRWQTILGTPVDGVISHPRSDLVVAVQRRLNAAGAGLRVDGGGIRQDSRRYRTVAALQRYLHSPEDGRLSAPRSMAVQALQRRLSADTF